MQLESGLEEGGGGGAVRRATEEREKCESAQRVVEERKQIERGRKRERERESEICFKNATSTLFCSGIYAGLPNSSRVRRHFCIYQPGL